MIKLLILGVSGSIGRQTLKIVEEMSDVFEVVGASVNRDVGFLNEVIYKYPSIQKVWVGDKQFVSEVTKVPCLTGKQGLKELVNMDYDVVVNAISGIAGLYPTLEAIKAHKDIAMANKEAIVCAGDLILEELNKNKEVSIYPIDSEHSALLQCLNGESMDDVSKLIITCSGGSLRDYKDKDLKNVTVAQVLKHPTWNMGKKITVDSATLFNKGFEIIEAHYLFGMSYHEIETVMHKQSVVHSLVEFKDGAIKALLGSHDMRLNILYAISGLKRIPNSVEKLDLTKIKDLTFEPINNKTFQGIQIVLEAANIGGTMLTCMNVANEEAVNYFLEGKIKFLDIYSVVRKAMKLHTPTYNYTLSDIERVEKETRLSTKEIVEGGNY